MVHVQMHELLTRINTACPTFTIGLVRDTDETLSLNVGAN